MASSGGSGAWVAAAEGVVTLGEPLGSQSLFQNLEHVVRPYAAKSVCNFLFRKLYTLLVVIIIKYFLFIDVALLCLEILTQIIKYHAHKKIWGFNVYMRNFTVTKIWTKLL